MCALLNRSTIALLLAATTMVVTADNPRTSEKRLRHPDSMTFESTSLSSVLPGYDKYIQSLAEDPHSVSDLEQMQAAFNTELDQERENFNALVEALETLDLAMSMAPSDVPSATPTYAPSAGPTSAPSTAAPTPTKAPSTTDLPSAGPSVSALPSAVPSISSMPSGSPSTSRFPTIAPTVSRDPTSAPADFVTPSPSSVASAEPTFGPTPAPTLAPTPLPTAGPTVEPTTPAPTSSPTEAPSDTPTFASCGISADDRIAQILALLDSVADSGLIRDESTPQGLATTWLLDLDPLRPCPDYFKLLQRWVLAVIYFATGGDDWIQCSANPSATDSCGAENPFVGEMRFLSGVGECAWAGISCINGCVTEIEFEENNLVGTIPSEIGLLEDLAIWGMERGRLTSTIPTQIGLLTNLIFLDLDFNELTGSLTAELLSLSSLTQLDLNNNQLTGSINGIGVFPDLEFLQLHDNFFTGTVPEGVGAFTALTAFTLHETLISGSMPQSVCDLISNNVLTSLIADCSQPNPDIECDCCTDCRDT